MNIFQLIGSLLGKSKAGERPISHKMESAIDTWLDFYESGNGSEDEKRSLELPAGISSEFARLVLSESAVSVSGKNDRAAYLEDQFLAFWNRFSEKAEIACALGSMVFKPYVSGDDVHVDLIRADQYVPKAFDSSGNVTAAIFMSRKTIANRYYTRLESHTWDADAHQYTVENRAYMSLSDGALGTPCALTDVDGWEALQPTQTIAIVERPLFAVFRVPSANRIDLDSPLGCSVFADAIELIREANDLWGKILWEYDGTELAVDASMDLFGLPNRKKRGLAKGKDRLFRKYDFGDDANISNLMQVFSPAIRDTSLFNGLNHIFQRIEFNVGLAYGTISNPQDIEKTAEEIRASKQRSYVHVSAIQRALESALNDLLYAMDAYTSLYDLAPAGDAELACAWGDSVLEDTEKEYQRRSQMVRDKLLKPELFLSWYFGCTPEEAQSMMPEQQDTDGLFSGSDA